MLLRALNLIVRLNLRELQQKENDLARLKVNLKEPFENALSQVSAIKPQVKGKKGK